MTDRGVSSRRLSRADVTSQSLKGERGHGPGRAKGRLPAASVLDEGVPLRFSGSAADGFSGRAALTLSDLSR